MTENEAIEFLKGKYPLWGCDEDEYENAQIAIQALEEIQQYRAIGTVGEVKMLKDYKELYDVYKLIGTIEEFRNLKYKKNVLPIATIEFSKEDMQKIVDETVAQIELNIQEIRAKAIDEFAEKLSLEISESIIWDMLATMSKNGSLSETSDKIVDYVIETSKKIAEQMKAGGING